MLSFGQYEYTKILTEFWPNLLYYNCYIEDILEIWVPSPNTNRNTWEYFKEKSNNWGTLKRVTKAPSTRVQFLDLDIKLENSAISIETYQKSMNLSLFILPLSAHPPSCFKGLICGELRWYWVQNTPEKFQELLPSFIQWLLDWGHTLQTLTPLLTQAAMIEDQKALSYTSTANTPDKPNILYIYWQHHPDGLQQSGIRQTYEKVSQSYLPFDNMRVAVSRPKNLRDILTKTALQLPQNIEIHDLLRLQRNPIRHERR